MLSSLCYCGTRYAKEHSFSAEQTSAFFSIMKATLQASQASRTSWVPLPESFAIFKGHCLNHSIPNAKTGAKQLFTVEEVKELTAFVTQSFYRHYKAYSVVFCEKQTVVPVARDAVVETPMRPTPLNDVSVCVCVCVALHITQASSSSLSHAPADCDPAVAVGC